MNSVLKLAIATVLAAGAAIGLATHPAIAGSEEAATEEAMGEMEAMAPQQTTEEDESADQSEEPANVVERLQEMPKHGR
jgi:hypothetical protein